MDQKSLCGLKKLGWDSFIIWECELKPDKRSVTLKNILSKIKELKY
jgi:G:T-mismatch repair DNA endonuclease (very short patch repair protein)